MGAPFEPTRDDGRSDRQVIYDLVCDAAPDTTFRYDEIIDALAVGVDTTIEKRRVYRAVTNANKLLLTERRRFLSVVREVGYRVIRSEEHLGVALDRKNSAVSKLQQGIDLLQHAKLSELSDAQRVLHQGQLMIMGGLYDAIRESGKRHDRQEQVIEEIKAKQEADIEELTRRLSALEDGEDT